MQQHQIRNISEFNCTRAAFNPLNQIIPRRTVSQLCNFPPLKGKMHAVWYRGHNRESRCDVLETISVNLHYFYSMLYCSDYFFLHREAIKKSKNNQRFFAKDRADPLALQMLPLWRRKKCCQDCMWQLRNIWGNSTNVHNNLWPAAQNLPRADQKRWLQHRPGVSQRAQHVQKSHLQHDLGQ